MVLKKGRITHVKREKKEAAYDKINKNNKEKSSLYAHKIFNTP